VGLRGGVGMAYELSLGNGSVFISHIMKDNGGGEIVHGILFRVYDSKHVIDSKDPEFIDAPFLPLDSDIVIWCSSLDSARVLQDVVNTLSLELNGRTVKDKDKDDIDVLRSLLKHKISNII
jgi:hypothetical protein